MTDKQKESPADKQSWVKCGIDRWRAYQWGNTRKGYWRIADSVILNRAIPNTSLKLAGYPCLMDLYIEWNRK